MDVDALVSEVPEDVVEIVVVKLSVRVELLVSVVVVVCRRLSVRVEFVVSDELIVEDNVPREAESVEVDSE